MEQSGDPSQGIAPEIRQQIISHKLSLWRNTYFDASLDATVAATLHDEQMAQAAQARMKQALQAIAALEAVAG